MLFSYYNIVYYIFLYFRKPEWLALMQKRVHILSLSGGIDRSTMIGVNCYLNIYSGERHDKSRMLMKLAEKLSPASARNVTRASGDEKDVGQ